MPNIEVELFANAYNIGIPKTISALTNSLYEQDIAISEGSTARISALNRPPRKGIVMAKGKSRRKGGVLAQWGVFGLFVRYLCEMGISVGIFAVFLMASWVMRWLSRQFEIPEFRLVFKLLELAILVLGALLCLYFIIVINIKFAKDLWSYFFPKRPEPKGGSK